MRLVFEILTLALCMTLFSALPLFSAKIRKYSRHIFLIGTGAMVGICFFDLVPDVLALGGSSSLYVMGGVWLVYSAVHILHLGHHHQDLDSSEHADHPHSGFPLFLGSLVAHCFASGMLLTASFGLSQKIASTVFAALIAHKIYESLLLSSILLAQKRDRLWNAAVIALYAAALPAGALLTVFFQASINEKIALLISSVAVGTLMGCLMFDFLLPSMAQLRKQRFKAGWIIAGLVLTQLVMRQI